MHEKAHMVSKGPVSRQMTVILRSEAGDGYSKEEEAKHRIIVTMLIYSLNRLFEPRLLTG